MAQHGYTCGISGKWHMGDSLHPQGIVDSYDDCPFDSCPQEPRHPWAEPLTECCLGNREMLKGYFAAVTAMDNNLGRIIDRVEELGLRENTLFVFASDNGFSCGHHGFWGKGNGTYPRNMYENSIRVPLVFSQPGTVPQDAVESGMFSAYDFAPTLLDYLGLPLPEGRNLPGSSFAAALHGKPVSGREMVAIYDEYGPARMIRTEEWKYVHRYPDGPHDLFDLVNDPDERANLASDPTYTQRAWDLKAHMDEWFDRYVEADTDGLQHRRDPNAPAGEDQVFPKQ